MSDYFVCVHREWAEAAGYPIGNDVGGPYIAIGHFTGATAQEDAQGVVEKFATLMEAAGTPLTGDPDGPMWVWSRDEMMADTRSRRGL